MNTRYPHRVLIWLGISATMASCGDTPFNPNIRGTVDAEVRDRTDGEVEFLGVSSGDFQVSIRSTDGTWVYLGTLTGIVVTLQGGTPTSLYGPSKVFAGTYDRVRLKLSTITFFFPQGGTIGGTVLTSDASAVAAGTSPLELEFSVDPFDVLEKGPTVGISFDLNVEQWITLQILKERVVPDEALRSQVGVAVYNG